MNLTEPAAKSTSERILEAAEGLFAAGGIRGTSLKEITELAEVNIAAVNYHFRSKDALVRAVYERCFLPLNAERLRLLDEAEQAAGERPLALEQVLYALFEPMVRAWQTNRNFILLVGRLQSEPDAQLSGFVQSLYGGMIEHFLKAARRAAPGVAEQDLPRERTALDHDARRGGLDLRLHLRRLRRVSGDCESAAQRPPDHPLPRLHYDRARLRRHARLGGRTGLRFRDPLRRAARRGPPARGIPPAAERAHHLPAARGAGPWAYRRVRRRYPRRPDASRRDGSTLVR
jgi:AcrR family transcriptional regulator